MNDLSEEIFERLTHIIERPTLYGTPEFAEGMAMGLAALWLRHRKNIAIDEAIDMIYPLMRKASSEIERPRFQVAFLCEETVIPERKTSFEAIWKHGETFLSLLKSEGYA